jgi:hypothetical protein
MTRIGADHNHAAMPPDDLAVFANPLDAGPDFHGFAISLKRSLFSETASLAKPGKATRRIGGKFGARGYAGRAQQNA